MTKTIFYITIIAITIYGAVALPSESFIEADAVISEDDSFLVPDFDDQLLEQDDTCQNKDAKLSTASEGGYATCDALKTSCELACDKDAADASKASKGDYTDYWCTKNPHSESIKGWFCPKLCNPACQTTAPPPPTPTSKPTTAATTPVKGKTMLIIGDSQAEFPSGFAYRTTPMEEKKPHSVYDFSSQCPTLTRVINRGVSSSEALEWNQASSQCPGGDKIIKAGPNKGQVDPRWSPRHCSFQHIIDKDLPKGVNATDIDFVYISLGANDMMARIFCDRSKLAGVADEAVGVVGQAVKLFPKAKILLTGYPMPLAQFTTWGITNCIKKEADGSIAVSMVRDLALDIAAKARAKYPTRVDQDIDVGATFGMFGGTKTSYTNNATYGSHADPIHMTTAGYKMLFGRTDVKKAMGCGSSATTEIEELVEIVDDYTMHTF